MDIPLHPLVVAEMARGRDFLDRVTAARRAVATTECTVACPDGDNTITFDGDGMVVAAVFTEDIFSRYPGEQLGEQLTTLCRQGYAAIDESVDDAIAQALRGSAT